MSNAVFKRLQDEVISPGLCTHCGTCAGLSAGALVMKECKHGPIPLAVESDPLNLDPLAYQACPGVSVDYPGLNQWMFNRLPESWLLGIVRNGYLGYSLDPEVRRAGSSGGVITQTLLYLLERGLVEGAVVLQHGWPDPWRSSPIIATTREEVLSAAQSVYVPTPVNSILDQVQRFEGRLAYVGLPDQVAAVRRLQQLKHAGCEKIEVILGPYVGTSMYLDSIRSFLKAHGSRRLEDIAELRYREGEWPGYLQIKLKSGEVLRAEKFYYNYLIPFFITTYALLSVDFTNELTDISVGDAWRPDLETQGQGFSVVLARTEKGQAILDSMRREKILHLEALTNESILAMHGHMIDFKKRGSFLRMRWRERQGLPVTRYGYHPTRIPFSRVAVEGMIVSLFVLGRTRFARWLVERIPISILGPLFDTLRKAWKKISKPTKRSGLRTMAFTLDEIPNPPVS